MSVNIKTPTVDMENPATMASLTTFVRKKCSLKMGLILAALTLELVLAYSSMWA
jgi:hypothetical protein